MGIRARQAKATRVTAVPIPVPRKVWSRRGSRGAQVAVHGELWIDLGEASRVVDVSVW